MNFLTRVQRPHASLLFALLLCGLLSLSFAPSGVKALLHTRGTLHATAHLVCFATLQMSLCACRRSRSRELWRSFALLGSLALLIEAAQTQGQWRYLEGADVLCDLLGIAVAAVLVVVLRRHRRLRLGRTSVQQAGLAHVPEVFE